MKNQTKNAGARRQEFDKVLPYYAAQGIVPQRAKLKAVAELKTGVDRLNFLFTKDNSLKQAIEMLLGKTDLFIGHSIGVALMLEKTGEEGLAPLYSYPVPAGDHLPTGLAGFENGNAFAIYNGKLIMRTGSTVNQSRLPLDECLYVPETQAFGLLNSSDEVVSGGVIPSFNIENVLIQLEERLILTGTKTQPFEIEFPFKSNATFGVPDGYKAYAVLIVDGWILETGATEEMKKPANGVKNPYADMF